MDSMFLALVGLVTIFGLAWLITTYIATRTDHHHKIPFETQSPESVSYHVDTDPGDDGRFI